MNEIIFGSIELSQQNLTAIIFNQKMIVEQ